MRQARIIIVALLLTLILIVTACSTEQESQVISEPVKNPTSERVPQMPLDRNSMAYKDRMAKVKANEAGQIMILMYHVIGAEKEGDWSQTADNFRRDLQTLFDQGYSLLSLRNLVSNNIDTPEGRTPVVLTFDDGTVGHFRYLEEDGKKIIDPDCAVGILLDFAEKNPLFGHTATFFVNDRPFGQGAYWQEKLQHLVDLGFDIGNHTLTHPKLNQLSDQEVQEEIAGLAQLVHEVVSHYHVTTLALPYGISPKNASLAGTGSAGDFSYRNVAVLRVGANPTVAPNVHGFSPLALPRVQASTKELTKWLDHFQKNPEERYISDGNPATIVVPADKEELIDKSTLDQKKLITW